jgi:hypothetical protein
MALWDWAVTFYASLGHHAAAIVFEVFLLVSLIVLRVFLAPVAGSREWAGD